MAMNRRIVISSLAGVSVIGLAACPAWAGSPVAVDSIERYLNGITTLEARFSQIAPNGQLATGRLQLARPGKLKMDYDPPSEILLVAPGDWRLIFYDGSIKQVNTIPISQTPLGVLLDAEIRLSGKIRINSIEEMAGETAITLLRPGQEDQGSVTLFFASAPISLRRWTIIDAQGLATTVVLEQPRYGIEIESGNFHWRDPKIFGFPED